MSTEIELKLALPPTAHAALRRDPVFAAAARQGPRQTLVNTYYDTPELDLQSHRVAVRVRQQGRQQLQTVKCAAVSTGGLSRRPEWETPWQGAFDFTPVDDPVTARLLRKYRKRLVPLFTTTFTRETRLHAPEPGTNILLMLDHGEVISGDQRMPISELELELADGDSLALLELARQLAAHHPLCPEDVSKAERGYRLFLGQTPQARRASPSAITPDMSVTSAFTELAAGCLRQWQGNIDGAALRHDAEAIHQLRVALRRLRSLLRIFADALPSALIAGWSGHCRALAEAAGTVRDLDALSHAILDPVRDCARRDGIDMRDLGAHFARLRDAAWLEARQALQPATQGKALLDLMRDLHILQRAPDSVAGSLRAFALTQLQRARKRVLGRHARATAEPGATQLHALRIACKRLRYALEFFQPLLPARATQRYLRQLSKVQEGLGYLQDLSVARQRYADFSTHHTHHAIALGYVFGWHAHASQPLYPVLLDEAQHLLEQTPPWQKEA